MHYALDYRGSFGQGNFSFARLSSRIKCLVEKLSSNNPNSTANRLSTLSPTFTWAWTSETGRKADVTSGLLCACPTAWGHVSGPARHLSFAAHWLHPLFPPPTPTRSRYLRSTCSCQRGRSFPFLCEVPLADNWFGRTLRRNINMNYSAVQLIKPVMKTQCKQTGYMASWSVFVP